ncbi:AraC-like DNA-binding protein [Gracilibacillus halotolerans]|uniref:AraC-like DNA-binding protein n=1 Tax=Gracilibacillus halotolerans TaxID=74386 RepID=A0A841RL00_9BACI|nr:AraC family transcriptional regulator [Gracilibacillus halotolerans]MBB6513421.1 AraC-like DNA-binding protein [Gracilibacillus halotolerans]
MSRVNVSLRKQSFYIDYAGSERMKNMDNPHLHNDYEIYYLLEGERYFNINGKQYKIIANQMVFIHPNVLHQTSEVLGIPHKRFVVNFRNEFLSEEGRYLLQRLFNDGTCILHVPLQKLKQIQALLNQMKEEYTNPREDSRLYLKSLLLQLLIISNRIRGDITNIDRTEKNDDYHVPDLLKYIHNHFHQNLSLHKLSQTFHLNEHYISRIFKRTTGFGFVEYVNHLRITEAERLLSETNLPVHLIAQRVGYSTQVHFNRVFKRAKGLSPNQYRQRI